VVLIKPNLPVLASEIFEKVKKIPPGGKPGGLPIHTEGICRPGDGAFNQPG
jgi:hypothetical protein